MDPLDRLVAVHPVAPGADVDPHARSAFALRVVMGGHWSIDVDDDAALSVLVMLSGSAVLSRAGASVTLEPGDVVLLPRGEAYVVADAIGSPPLVRILPGQVCSATDGSDLTLRYHRGVRTWGNATDGETTMLIGAYETAGAAGAATLASLPPIARVPAGRAPARVVDLLALELGEEGVGQQTIIDRLLDVLVVTTVRAFLDAEPAAATGWLAAGGDLVVAEALRLLHSAPEDPWTVESLARRVLVSRATLSARFRERVGLAPIAYLSRWRLSLACDLLDAGASVTSVAERLGYASPFSFSAAFKRQHGVSPSGYRKASARP